MDYLNEHKIVSDPKMLKAELFTLIKASNPETHVQEPTTAAADLIRLLHEGFTSFFCTQQRFTISAIERLANEGILNITSEN